MQEPLPAVFEPAFYVERHSDLAGMGLAEAADHYERHGRAEGRIAAPLAVREGLLRLAGASPFTLEIGPFCNPVLKGDNIRYLDVLDASQLRDRAIELGLDPAGCPEEIHYVGEIDQIAETFDAVVSSHSIEHQPDLITHLRQVARILKPGGRYYVICPDRRYCFDHYIAESTVAEIVDAHHHRRDRHTLRSVIEHVALSTHNDPGRHWSGDHGAPLDPDGAMRVKAAIQRFSEAAGGYVDVHAWYFTPDGFRMIVETLFRLDLSPLRAAAVYDTAFNRAEFCAVLERG